jgi:hypothetical protein
MSEKERVATWLQSLTDMEFIKFFYEHLAFRNLYPEEAEYSYNHLVLANASRLLGDDGQWKPWELVLLCPTSRDDGIADGSICQFGEHCGHPTASWAKDSVCPICGGYVYGT